MAPVAELPVDRLAYRGFATILYDVLDSLGVPIEQIEYVCQGEPGPDGFKGHIVVHLKVPASEFVPVPACLRDTGGGELYCFVRTVRLTHSSS
jgi:hypothetical protein